MPINGYHPSSQTVFYPRQSSLSHPYSMSNGHVFSSRTPALRAASAEPSAVRPDGLGDARESFSETTVVRRCRRRWMGNAPGAGGGKIKALWEERLKARPSLRRIQIVARPLCRTPEVLVHQNHSMPQSGQPRVHAGVRPGVKTALERSPMSDKVSLSETCRDRA